MILTVRHAHLVQTAQKVAVDTNFAIMNAHNVAKSPALLKPRAEIAEPPMFRVLLHNDDYTPMDFVVDVLTGIFHFDETTAHRIMLEVHNNGIGHCGVFTKEIAETKVALVTDLAKAQGYPLKCSMDRN